MDSLVLGIIALVVALILTLCLLLVYTGIFQEIDVNTGKPPIGSVRVAYKFGTGPYGDCGYLFTDVVSIVPDLRTIGVYYDDPKKVEPNNQRYIVGAILSEGTSETDKEKEARLLEKDFKLASFPAVDHAVIASFPYIWMLSTHIATFRVWPRLGEYIQERSLCAHPAIEICSGDEIQYMLPLCKQEDFYVEEAIKAKQEEKSSSADLLEGNVTEGNEPVLDDTTVSSEASRSSNGGNSSGSESSFEELSLQEGESEEASLQEGEIEEPSLRDGEMETETVETS